MNGHYCTYCMQKRRDDSSACEHCHNTAVYDAPIHHMKPGTVLKEKYMIGRALGEGGFGITYIGRDLTLDMRVAVKEFYPNGYAHRNHNHTNEVSLPQSNNRQNFEKDMQRFLTEARILAKFSEEQGVVGVRDFFRENGTAYIVMEYLDGITLKNYLKAHGTIPAEELFAMLDPVLETLNLIHAQGLIHRDISPDNIMVLKNGKLKLLDFGAAREANSDKSLSVVLKHGYAPEEQYRSKGKQGPWTDVYAMCATMYKCLTGITPPESLERAYDDELQAPSKLGVSISRTLETTLLKGLCVRVGDRIQSINELREGLFSYDDEEPIQSVIVHKHVEDDDVETIYDLASNDSDASLQENVEDVAKNEMDSDVDDDTCNYQRVQNLPGTKPVTKKFIFWAIIFAIITIAVVVMVLGKSNSDTPNTDNTNTKTSDSRLENDNQSKGENEFVEHVIVIDSEQIEVGQTTNVAFVLGEYTYRSDDDLVWTSSNSEVASVSQNGTITGLASGSTVISGQLGDLRSELTITVVGTTETMPQEIVQFETLEINCHTSKLLVGDAVAATLIADSWYLDGDSDGIVWSIDNGSVATIDSRGYITGLAPGICIVTAKYKNLTASAELAIVEVDVSSDAEVVADYEKISLYTGGASTVNVTFGGDLPQPYGAVVYCSPNVNLSLEWDSLKENTVPLNIQELYGASDTGDITILVYGESDPTHIVAATKIEIQVN